MGVVCQQDLCPVQCTVQGRRPMERLAASTELLLGRNAS